VFSPKLLLPRGFVAYNVVAYGMNRNNIETGGRELAEINIEIQP